MRCSILIALAVVAQPAAAQIMPPPIAGITVPAEVDPDAYCFVQNMILSSALKDADSLTDTPAERADIQTQREAVGIAVHFYVGALSRRFDPAGGNAAVAKALAALKAQKSGDMAGAQDGLRCAYAARDRMHEIMNGVRVSLGVPAKP